MRDRIIQLQESAEDLGFSTIQQAIDAGYHEVQDLEHNTFKLKKLDSLADQAYAEAHKAWLAERDEVLRRLAVIAQNSTVSAGHRAVIKQAIDFIREGEM